MECKYYLRRYVFMKKWIIGKIIGILGLFSIVLLAAGISTKINGRTFSIIGGSDGPTSIFLAGKVRNDNSLLLIGAGIVTAVLTVVLFLINKKKGS